MPISRSLFDLAGNLPMVPHELESQLSKALVDTTAIPGVVEPDWVRELWCTLSEFQRGSTTSKDFMEQVNIILGSRESPETLQRDSK